MIGANGFAKVGDPDIDRKAEIKLNFLLNQFNISYPVPEEFKEICGITNSGFFVIQTNILNLCNFTTT